MTNFNDPDAITQDYLTMVKLWHTLGGLYIWEFVTTLGYEWNVIRRRLPYLWTIWIHSLARVAALLGVIFRFALMDSTSPFSCHVAFSFMTVFSFLSATASSLLIFLRVIAIWNKNKVVVVMAICVWGANAAFFIQGVVRLRASWVPAQPSCIPVNAGSIELSLIALPITDTVLLLMMLVGLLRLRRHGSGTFGLVQVLWRQGVIWLLLATVAEVPPVVLAILNLNAPLGVMLQPSSRIALVIGATRMYRALVDFTSRSTDKSSNLPAPQMTRISAASISMDHMEVAMHVVCEQNQTPQTTGDGPYIGTVQRGYEKPKSFGLDGDV